MMFKLKPLSLDVRKQYYDMISPDLEERIKNGVTLKNGTNISLPPNVIDELIPGRNTPTPDYSVLKSLLCAEPKELNQKNTELWLNFRVPEGEEKALRKKIAQVFDYNGVFNTSDKSKSFWLAKLIERNTCPYCNRQYCFTVERGTGRNKNERIARPSFDHWFLKSKYPLLSLSLHNLIPSCPTCNTSVRASKDMTLDAHINPYVDYSHEPKSETSFRFRATKKISERFAWELKIDRKPGTLIDETIKTFALDEIYAYHEKLEVRDIMMFDARYKKGYLSTLFNKVIKDGRLRMSREEVFRLLFGTELNEDRFLSRPFSKLKHDLLVQIGVITDSK